MCGEKNLETIFEFQMGIGPPVFQTPVRCSNHWTTENLSGGQVLCGLTNNRNLNHITCTIKQYKVEMNNDDPVVNPLENFCGKENFKAQN